MTQEELKRRYSYNYDGTFTNIKTNKVVYGKKNKRYKVICIRPKEYKYHRMVFLFHNGWLPKTIDHINRNTSDNRIENLRACTTRQNTQNKSLSKTSTTGFKGVSWSKHANKWRVSIRANGKSINLGYFFEIKDAALAYDLAAKKMFGEFACTNF